MCDEFCQFIAQFAAVFKGMDDNSITCKAFGSVSNDICPIAGRQKQFDTELSDLFAQFGVQLFAFISKFIHGTADKDASLTGFAAHSLQTFERILHGCRICIIAVVYDGHFAERNDLKPHAR